MPLRRLLALPLLVALLGIAAACGGGGGDETVSGPAVPDGAVAIVGDTPITQADFDEFFAQTQAGYEARGEEFPRTGTPEYEKVKNDIVNLLVQREELEREAVALGVAVTDEEVQTRLDELKQQFFEGDQAKYEEELRSLGLSEEGLRRQLRSSLLSQRLYAEITKDVTVTPDEVQAYYDEHQDEFTTPEVRDVAHILAETEAEAKALRTQLVDGADFATLAREKSTDEVSAADGGNLGEQPREQWVKEFGDALWALETGELSQPVESEFGWHVIKALGDIKPEKVTPFADVKTSIEEQVLAGRKDTTMQEWIDQVRAKYAAEVGYAVGYAPASGGLTSTLPSTG